MLPLWTEGGGGLTYESLEQVALEDVDDPLDRVSKLLVLGTMQLGLIILQEEQSSLSIYGRQETDTFSSLGTEPWQNQKSEQSRMDLSQ